MSYLCVPTPVDDNFYPDLGPVKNATLAIVRNFNPGQLVDRINDQSGSVRRKSSNLFLPRPDIPSERTMTLPIARNASTPEIPNGTLLISPASLDHFPKKD